MDTHKNAPLTPKGREMMVRAVLDCGLRKAVAARQFNTTPKTVGKWVERFRAQGVDGLKDRSSRLLSSPSQTAPAACAAGGRESGDGANRPSRALPRPACRRRPSAAF